ncbi:N-6 DNA methylase [Polaribacter batillariae]|uniref:site-specific DNA-methyltransferase (adenine-specific) n=1 Tax=Polaribacter batillariae TaxID=2808900 RepID=A0ABX7SX39_9FLAO|nr:N-6 DNA methylase [Polaribacter batillariae]QTD38033.1 N-6 DNA methylase [Polaribacter batillariae]
MKNLFDIQVWKQQLGLLPIHLNPLNENGGHMMLNGGNGDFCLKTTDLDNNNFDFYSKSWSSSTKNFLTVQNENIHIHNWLNDKTETVSQKIVAENFNKFYNYLLSKSYKSSKDLVPFIIDIFRQFRNLTFEKSNPVQALNLLFGLLTSLEDDVNNLDTEKWGLQNIDIPDGFGYYIEQIQNGFSNVKPEFDLIIRHSAGILFQEAQKEVLFFNPQRDLFGGTSSTLNTKTNLYSSIHYTPPFLSRTIVENSLRNINLQVDTLKILDPACGSSEFLIEVLKQLKELNYQGSVEIFGWDISETAINTSRFLLTYEKRTIWKDKLEFNLKLVEDSLLENWDEDYNLILMNPPFSSWELLNTKARRDAIRDALGNSFIGKKPNQASAFYYKAINSLNEDGVLGCVIPSSILTLDSYSKLRTDTEELIDIKLLGKLGNFIFEDALTDVSFIICKKPISNQIPTIIWTKNEKGVAQEALRDFRKSIYNNQITLDNQNYSVYQPISFPILKESWMPISIKNHDLYKGIERFVVEKRLTRVIDIFSVKQGIRTGNNKAFKISVKDYINLPEEEKCYFRPATENESFKNGQIKVTSYVWYPYSEDGIQILTEDEFAEKVPVFYERISNDKIELSNRARKDVSNWWHLSEHRAWLRKSSLKLISAEFGNSGSFGLDKEGNFVVERGNAWIPKKNFTKDDYFFYLALFSSVFFNKLLAIYSKELLSGWDLGKKYTKNIPIPNVHLEEVKNSEGYQRMIEIGKELSEGNIYTKSISDNILERYFYPNI